MKNVDKLFTGKWRMLHVFHALLLIGIGLWVYPQENISDFGLNFFTEVLGVLITVYIIDYLVKMRDEERIAPMKVAVYQDAFNFYSTIYYFWIDLYEKSVPKKYPETVEEFFTPKGMGEVFNHLWLDSKLFDSSKDWEIKMENHKNKLLEIGNRFLERHTNNVEPELYMAVHGICEGNFIQRLDSLSFENSNRHLRVLGNFVAKARLEDYEFILTIYYWLKLNYHKFSSYGVQKPYHIIQESLRKPYKIPDEVINEFRKNS